MRFMAPRRSIVARWCIIRGRPTFMNRTSPTMETPGSPTPTCIAVVNDDTVFVGLMTELLETEAGYRVISCLEGNKVYDFIKAEQPDLVLLDLVLNREE